MISLHNVNCFYPGASEPALKEVNLTIKKKETVLLAGPSGAGKTTLLYLLNGIIPQIIKANVDGSVRINGFCPSQSPMPIISRQIGTIFQNPQNQIFASQVYEDAAFGCENLMFPGNKTKNDVKKALKEIGLWELRDRNVHHLSAGEKRKLAIAGILAMGPKIILMDEPLGDLDIVARKMILKTIAHLKTTNCTIIIAEHRIDEALQVADRVVWVDKGSIYKSCSGVSNISKSSYSHPSYIKNENLITAEEVRFTYKPGIRALNGVNIELKKGEFAALTGPNGSGKTTLLKLLAGLIKPEKGKVIIGGKTNPSMDELIGKVGFLSQNPDEQLFNDSVINEVYFGPNNLNLICDVRGLILDAGLSGYEERHPQTLSRGERQRVALISILAMGPEILLLDEPTTGLDEKNWVKLMKMIERLNTGGATIVFATHNEHAVERFATRYIELNEGKIKHDQIL